jgi:uncharacterized protein
MVEVDDMDEEDDLVMSELCGFVTVEGIELDVQIYRGQASGWLLEVLDPENASHVWNEEFETDQLAFEEFERTLRVEGVAAFIDGGELDPRVPLSDFEWRLLAQQIFAQSGWDLDFVQGVLAAACIHPAMDLYPSNWLPLLLGDKPAGSAAEAQRTVGLILRGYNQVQDLLDQDKSYVPEASDWPSLCTWCRGFVDCMMLNDAWRDDPEAMKLLAPALAIASSTTATASTKMMKLARAIREEQDDAVQRKLFDLHDYFKVIRSEVMKSLAKTKAGRNERERVGRNSPCPCGSGKKYKRCCGR